MNRNLRRRALTAALVFGLIGVWAPASVFAHVEFENAPATVAPNSDIALTLHVANESETAGDFNVAVITRLPEGWTGVSCEEKPTWTCEITTVSQRVEVHFEKADGAGAAEDELFEFTLHSSATLGTASFPTLQTYALTGEVGWVGDPDTENPAPILEVADPAAATTTTPGAATTTVAPATTAAATTTLAPTTTTAEVTTTAEPESSTTVVTGDTTVDTATILETTATTAADSADDGENTGLIIAIIVLLAAAAAGTILYLRRRKPPVPPTGGIPPAVVVPSPTDPTVVVPTAMGPTVADPGFTDPGPLDQTIENPDINKPTDGSE
jgi:Domain of unkown function (DUF1775)